MLHIVQEDMLTRVQPHQIHSTFATQTEIYLDNNCNSLSRCGEPQVSRLHAKTAKGHKVGESSLGITGQPMKRIFFSPHPDDIAYSCFGTIQNKPRCCSSHNDGAVQSTFGIITPPPSPQPEEEASGYYTSKNKYLPRECPSVTSSCSVQPTSSLYGPRVIGPSSGDVIVSVFTTSRCANGEIGATLKHSVPDTTSLRAKEDEAFARKIGSDLVWLGFPDSSARDEPSRRPDLTQKALSSKQGTMIERVDHEIYDDVRLALIPIVKNAVQCGAQMHIPLGVGSHIDHWMVRVAILSIVNELYFKMSDVRTISQKSEQCGRTKASPTASSHVIELLTFYEDLPYADQSTKEHIDTLAMAVLPFGARSRLVTLNQKQWQAKQAAVELYASQMKATILPSLAGHAKYLATGGRDIDDTWSSSATMAERIWFIGQGSVS